MKLEPCDIILVKGQDSWISKEIEEVERSIYSHSAIMVKQSVLIEAGWQKVKYNAIDYYDGTYDVYRCELDNFQKAQIVNYLVNQIGKRYDYKLLFYEWCRYRLGIILPIWFKNTNNEVICSELISDSYRSIGIDLCPGIKYPSPADLSESKLLTLVQSK